MEISFHAPENCDAIELERNLLPADRDEILAMGHDPVWAIQNSLATSLEAVVIRKGGVLACITGVCQPIALSGDVYPWLLSTPVILENPIPTLRLSKTILNRWRAVHPYMSNYVDARHWRALHWLQWLGAELSPAEPFGPFKRPFHKFTFGAPDVH